MVSFNVNGADSTRIVQNGSSKPKAGKTVLAKVEAGAIFKPENNTQSATVAQCFGFGNGNKEITYKDFNNDGFITGDEIYQVTEKDGSTETTYTDSDGDGYADIKSSFTEDENGIIGETESIDIDEMRNSNLPHTAENFKMNNIISGLRYKSINEQ